MKIHVPIPIASGFLGFIVFSFFTLSSSAQSIDFGKSYVNITKGVNGGTVEPGDTLEIRASLVVKSGTYDSCGYFDVVPSGTSYIPGTIRVLTNEGKIYKQFTDVAGDDPGWISNSNIRINLGYDATNTATAFRRGRITNTSLPSFYGSTCIMIASFRVKVDAVYNATVSIGGGSITYKSGKNNPIQTYTYPGRTIAVYPNYGICPNAVGANTLGTEFNGTFGTGAPANRGTSSNVPTGYTYSTFTSNSPNDYYYGIANNTSINTGFTTSNDWPKPDATHRVFGVWDIIGDHTGASDPALGNPAAPANTPGSGYMLVINAAYRIDSAFQQTISGLCPNTYYEISCWIRNICSRCGCDVNGTGASGTGYIPTGPGDSSGVHPNLSFGIDGMDYYTTGDIPYTGAWIKKGFTFLTGPSQTSFTLKFFNNAPGGGGNDWALDDISVATCSPNLSFTPDNNPVVCVNNAVSLGAYIRSYFNNYTYYKWQKSTNNGLSWADAGSVQTGSPVKNGSDWEYYTSYPQFISSASDSGSKFRIVVASTTANINDPNCSFADATSVLTLHIQDCGPTLKTDIISFSGKKDDRTTSLQWTTTREEERVQYLIEKSTDGKNFSEVGRVNSGDGAQKELNYYQWTDPFSNHPTCYYRIRLLTATQQKLSRVIKLSIADVPFSLVQVPNPFTSQLSAEVQSPGAQLLYVQLIDNNGQIIRRQSFTLTGGLNQLQMNHLESLPTGLYTLQFQSGREVVSKRVLKKS